MRRATGMVRKLDPLGRLVIPKEMRKTLEFNEYDPIEMFVEDDCVIIKKYKNDNTCVITGETSRDNISILDGKITVSSRGLRLLTKEIDKLNGKK